MLILHKWESSMKAHFEGWFLQSQNDEHENLQTFLNDEANRRRHQLAQDLINRCMNQLTLDEAVTQYFNEILQQQISCPQDLECLELVGKCLSNTIDLLQKTTPRMREHIENKRSTNLCQLRNLAEKKATGHPCRGAPLVIGAGLFLGGASTAGVSFMLMFVLGAAMVAASNPFLLIALVMTMLVLTIIASSTIGIFGASMAIGSMESSGFAKNLLFFADEMERKPSKRGIKLNEKDCSDEEMQSKEDDEYNGLVV